MKLRTILFDLIFIVVLSAVLIMLSETGKMGSLMKYPFVTIYAAYGIGRLAGVFSGSRRKKREFYSEEGA
jgi:hypothetical protein